MLEFYEYVLKIYDTEKAVDIIYLDFKKAFDKVPHERLILKIKSYGIEGNLLKWIRSWLSDRQQRVVLDGTTSEWLQVTSGVPQGSVLGPILFVMYINDIDDGIESVISKFADDTKLALGVSGDDNLDICRRDLELINKWGSTWQMEFNADKCATLHIGSTNPRYNHKLGNNYIKSSKVECDLGIQVMDNLKSTEQCNGVVKKANKIVGLINRSFEYKTEKIMTKLYKSLVRPILEYGVQAWSPYHKTNIDKLERVQRRATKSIPGLKYKEYEERLKRLNLTSLKDRRVRIDLIETFKILNQKDNIDPDIFFELNTNATRNNGSKLIKKRTYTNEYKHSFSNRVVNPWNALPPSVINSVTVSEFKAKLDKHLAT
jgi:predicted component of type VI protein secretion system